MESLFNSGKPRRGRVALMLAGSLVFHGGLVGIATMYHAPEPAPHSVPFEGFETPSSGPVELPDLPQAALTPAAELATPTPDVDRPQVDEAATPPPSDEPEFSEPNPVREHTVVVKPVVHPQSTSVSRSNAPAATSPGAGASAGSRGAGPAMATTAWSMPHPPYPMRSVTIRPTGATTVRITTDAMGAVSNVVIIHSTGNAMLDAHTVSYVRANWHGPANATRTTEFIYELR